MSIVNIEIPKGYSIAEQTLITPTKLLLIFQGKDMSERSMVILDLETMERFYLRTIEME